ncbi:hypothetical protein [Agromyces bauzanensis]
MPDAVLLISMAEIAGIFVGFGALISVRSTESREARTVAYLSSVMWMGLWVVFAALIPLGVIGFGLAGRALWLPCSLVALALWWIAFFVARLSPEFRTDVATTPPARNALYMAVGAVPFLVLNGALVLTAVGVWPELAPALYTIAVMACLILCGFTLFVYVFTQPERQSR